MMSKLTIGLLAVVIALQALVLSGQAVELRELRGIEDYQHAYGDDILRAVDDLEDDLRRNRNTINEMAATLGVMNMYGVTCDEIP